MVLETIKNLIPNYKNKYPKKFQNILECFEDDFILNPQDIELLWKAYQFGDDAHIGQKRKSGVPYFDHCIEVSKQLIKWNMDLDTIIAGLLHDTIEDTPVTKTQIKKEFNIDISNLVYGVSKLSDIKFKSHEHKQAENLMKMFLSVAKDLRVIMIKFSDRLHNMSTLSYLPINKRKRIAIETRDVYAPLAHRLGMNRLKMKYENLVLENIHPDQFTIIKKKVNSTSRKREKYIRQFSNPIQIELDSINVSSEIKGRAKHYYSIHRKMELRSKKFEELFDLLAIRIILDKVEECYAVLGIVHKIYTPIQDRFKDYIATPKSNGYQSIHTTVFGHDEKIVEVQIRTKEMDKLAEVGVAAHWIYKEKQSEISNNDKMNNYIKWLRELVDLMQSENKNPNELLELLKIDLFQDEIFVFSPGGDVHQLKQKSTPIDFAFSVHTQVGLKCSGAKVNGKIVPLNTELNNGDTIEIITSVKQHPNPAWLKMVQTTKAITHIKRVIKQDQENKSIALGKEILEKALRKIKKLGLLKLIDKEPNKMGYNNSNMIYSYIGKGKITVNEVLEKFDVTIADQEFKIDEENSLTKRFLNRARGIAKGVKVDGISNTMISFPKCCGPIPGDLIIGYITRGKGVTIHRSNCKNIPIEKNQNRLINVEWDVNSSTSFLVRLKIVFEDRKHLLKDLTETTSLMNINIKSVDISAENGIATCLLVLETNNVQQLSRLKEKIKSTINPINIERM